MTDMNAAREAAERSFGGPGAYHSIDGYRPRMLHPLLVDDLCQSARALLWLTDTTPLTWDVVCKESGGRRLEEQRRHYYDFGPIMCERVGDRLDWWNKDGETLQYEPRTLGELRQLIRRTSEPN